jgi:glycerate dehydrogenase
MRGVILDAASMGDDVGLDPITDCLDEWEVYHKTSAEEVSGRIQFADVVLTNKVRLEASHLLGASQLKLVGLLATGTNNVDLAAAKQAGICVCNAVAYATPSVTQHTIGVILALATNLLNYVEDVNEGVWQNSDSFCLHQHPIIELAGKNLGIIGYGMLGQAVARVAKSLGMNILVSERPGAVLRPDRMEFESVLKQSDVISLHCPLTSDNHHLINKATLELMKPTALLVNTARGGLVDSRALVSALREGRISGAAIDVVDIEPPTPDEPLLSVRLPNLIVTPHNAWCARESRERLVVQVRDYINGFLSGRPVNRVA